MSSSSSAPTVQPGACWTSVGSALCPENSTSEERRPVPAAKAMASKPTFTTLFHDSLLRTLPQVTLRTATSDKRRSVHILLPARPDGIAHCGRYLSSHD